MSDYHDPEALALLTAKLTPGDQGCLDWTGAGSSQKHYIHRKGFGAGSSRAKPECRYHGKKLHPQQVAWGLANGVDPRTVGLVKPVVCGNPLCCNANHLAPRAYASAPPPPITLEIAERIAKAWPIADEATLAAIIANENRDPVEEIDAYLDSIGDAPNEDASFYNICAVGDNKTFTITEEHLAQWRVKNANK